MTKTYIDFLEEAAQTAVDLDVVGRDLQVEWENFEAFAKDGGYDVFGGSRHDACRNVARRLVRLLYRVPGALREADVAQLREKDREYGGSWQTRGGVGPLPGGYSVGYRLVFGSKRT